ncbi:MAG: hypothetical protein RML37_05605 [Chitinophagales bacterium]|nr:hypothetical protein [Chitinophagales bacterium]
MTEKFSGILTISTQNYMKHVSRTLRLMDVWCGDVNAIIIFGSVYSLCFEAEKSKNKK